MYLLPPSFSSFFLFFFSPPPPPPLTLLVTPPPPPLFSSSSLLPSPLLRLPYPLISSPLMGRGGILLVYLDTWCLRSYLPLPSLYLVLPPLLPPSPFSDSLSLTLCFLLFFPLPPSPSPLPSPFTCASTCSLQQEVTSAQTQSCPNFTFIAPVPAIVPKNPVVRATPNSQVNLSISTPPCTHSNNYLFTRNYQMEKLEIIPKNDT